MKYGIFLDKEWLFDDSESTITNVDLVCADNSYACFQMIAETEGEIKIGFSDELDFEVYRLVPTIVNRNSDFMEVLDYERTPLEEMDKYYIRKAPYNIYDAMVPVKDNSVCSDGKIYLYFKAKTNKPGIKKGSVILCNNGENTEIPYAVTVKNARVPDKRTFNMINWINYTYKRYGCELYDDRFWQILEKIIKLSEISRQNYVNVSSLFITRRKDGSFDFTNTKRYIELCFKYGYTKIEGPGMPEIYGTFFSKECGGKPFYTDESKEAVVPFLTAWYDFLKENDWLDITVQHIFDEPREKNIEFYGKLAAVIRENMPGVKLVDTTLTLKIGESPDILIPTTRFYQLHKDFFENLRAEGRELWNYTCCWPSAPYLNRFLDMPLMDVRLIHWLNYYTNCNGYLHWGFCFLMDGIDQFETPSIPFKIFDDSLEQYLPAGDTNIIYEYEGEPVGSVRLEMQRAGVEDYELLCMIKDKKTADELVATCISEDYTGIKDISEFNKIYEKLLEAVEN